MTTFTASSRRSTLADATLTIDFDDDDEEEEEVDVDVEVDTNENLFIDDNADNAVMSHIQGENSGEEEGQEYNSNFNDYQDDDYNFEVSDYDPGPGTNTYEEGQAEQSVILLETNGKEVSQKLQSSSEERLNLKRHLEAEPQHESESVPTPAPELRVDAETSQLPPKPIKRRRATKRNEDQTDESHTQGRSKSIVLKLHKVPTSSGGTNKINAIDIVSQIVLDLIQIAQEKIETPAIKQAVGVYHDTVAQQFYQLIDAVDVTQSLITAVRRAETTRSNLRTRLIGLRQERANVHAEMQKIRDENSKILSEQAGLRDIGLFAAELSEVSSIPFSKSKPVGTSVSNVQSQLDFLEPIISRDYGSYDRIRLLNNRLERLLQKCGAS